MIDVKILGPGCPKCKVTASQVRRTVEQLGIEVVITKVEKIEEIKRFVLEAKMPEDQKASSATPIM
ncbi:MAG: hypothetical protein A2Y16_05075 [Tenericutes bacterium GWF2_57_13]|nr:MAG: hypothetical protein A2Y16_05075 [Tenericutes bacterium GWF2_57_13]